ncbi:MAG: hypothetical protein ABL962_10950 [Fimbriimonadaceae bacterium]
MFLQLSHLLFPSLVQAGQIYSAESIGTLRNLLGEGPEPVPAPFRIRANPSSGNTILLFPFGEGQRRFNLFLNSDGKTGVLACMGMVAGKFERKWAVELRKSSLSHRKTQGTLDKLTKSMGYEVAGGASTGAKSALRAVKPFAAYAYIMPVAAFEYWVVKKDGSQSKPSTLNLEGAGVRLPSIGQSYPVSIEERQWLKNSNKV